MATVKYNLGTVGGIAVTELWSGSVGSLADRVDNVKITLNDDLTNYKFLVFDFHCEYYSSRKYYSRVISVQQFTNLFNNTNASEQISFAWGYNNANDYFEIAKDSTTKVLNIVSNCTECIRIVGIN